MFRRQEDTIEPDPVYPANLRELGFFVNELGHIRMIEAPEKAYVFRSTNNERVNELRQEAMQECLRQETEKRLSALGISRVYLPEFTTTKPNGPHVPILSPPPEILKTRKRIVVLVNDAMQDLGILAYRQMQRELGLNGASVVNFVKELLKRSATGDAAKNYKNIFNDGFRIGKDSDIPALVVLNTAQLLYSHKHNKAMTLRSWSAMPRKSVAHDMITIHEEENRIQGHRNSKEHVKSVFDNVICNPDRVAPDAEVYLIAIEGGTESTLNVLGENFEKYGPRVTAMALIHSLIDDSQIKNHSVRALLHQRTREWRYSDSTGDPRHCTELPAHYVSKSSLSNTKIIKHIAWNEDLPESGTLSDIKNALRGLIVSVGASKEDEDEPRSIASDACTDWSSGQAAICPTFAGGQESSGECIFTNPAVQHAVLAYFEDVAQNPQNYHNPDIKIFAEVPHPTPDHPLALDPNNPDIAVFASLPPELTPEHAELDLANEKFEETKIALKACPVNVPELQQGRVKLIERIADQEVKIAKLKQKTLAAGGFTAGQVLEQRENWKPQREGKKVKFAGTMVDSELLRAAGLMDTADEALEKLGKGGI